ncbi:DUF2029 domain-containing protein [Rhodobacteraceae bacterium 63075]|nr:DUF2029 domain-containing protein [Rhodobacteraceae bacterium 63075]
MSRSSFVIILALLAALMGFTALRIGAPDLLGVDAVSADYMIFHQVGELSRLGRAGEAYDAEAFRVFQQARTGSSIFMTWTYPPHFNLALHPFARLPPALGYLLFTGLGFALFLWSMFRLAPGAARPILLLCLPAITMNLLTGQNGFLTGALMALTCHFALTGAPVKGGLALGLLTYKPHLGLGLGLAALLRGGLRLWGTAALVLGLLALLATLAYGPQIWQALAGSVETSGELLASARYKLERMSTVFALTASLGLAPELAMLLQMLAALAGLGLVAFAALRGWQLASVLCLGILSGTMTSPYAYDYDLCLLAPALALAWQPIRETLSPAARALLGAGVLLSGGYGLGTVIFSDALKSVEITPPSLGGIGLLIALALIVTALARAERT